MAQVSQNFVNIAAATEIYQGDGKQKPSSASLCVFFYTKPMPGFANLDCNFKPTGDYVSMKVIAGTQQDFKPGTKVPLHYADGKPNQNASVFANIHVGSKVTIGEYDFSEKALSGEIVFFDVAFNKQDLKYIDVQINADFGEKGYLYCDFWSDL